MSVTIRYKDTLHQHEVLCDPTQGKVVRDFIGGSMIHPQPFDFMVIDLSDENCEEVHCYQGGDEGRIICSFGGAAAWNIYRSIAAVWPEINYYTAGRPPLIL